MKKLLATLLSLLMLMSLMPMAAFSVHVHAEMGGDFPWTDASEKMLIEEILERDGLIDGIWMPWFNESQTGHNLTGNDLMAEYYNSKSTTDWARVEMDYYGADKIYREIYNLKAMGYNVLAYGGSIFGEGVIFDENGDVTGIKQEYLDNARRLLNMCREIGMPVMWNVYFHDSSMPSYYGMEGWHVICQMLGNNEIADHYAENFVRPLCKMLAEYPDVVAMVSIADEPENQINDLGKGDHFETKGREMYGVNQDDMIYFMQQINEVVREELPNVARTVASNNGNKTIYRDFDLDITGHNQYTDGDTFKSVESLLTDADVILSEYNVGTRINDDAAYAEKLIGFREWMMANGYKGGFQWCWTPKQYSGAYALQRNSTGTAFRKTVALLRYFMDEYRAEYRGETITLDAPVLYANAGDGKVLFIPSKRATKITIQRSDDGGVTWKSLVTNVAQSTYVDQYLVGTYTDSTSRPSSGYCYRIIAMDNAGNSVTSEPNDLAGTDKTFKKTYSAPTYKAGKYYITSSLKQADAKLTSFGVLNNRPLSEAANLIENGSFESTGGQWNTASFLQYAQVVNDGTTPDGSKSLYFNTSAQSNEGWYTFTVDGLKANTEYTFSAFIKGGYLADDNKGQASIGVLDPDTGKYMFYWEYFRSYPRASRETKQMYPTAYDDEWHIRSVTFNSGEMGSVDIALYGYSTKMWVDGLALFETSKGAKYETGESAQALTSTEYSPASGATNAVSDPAINNASYWSDAAGYKQGFMSIASGKLKYTASSAKAGVRYTKWIDVKPGTDYYYSYTVNVTSAGNGRVAIMDNSMLLPNEVVSTKFSSTGTKTVTGRISTGAYDQLGLTVVDLGGIATIDNVYLYEGDESVIIPTTPSYDGYIINGDFEVGTSTGWENLWNNNTVEIVAGRDSSFAMKGTAGGSYTQVRQKITVEKNTDYVIEVWAKNVNGTTLIVKDSADANLKQTGLQGSGSTWTKTVLEFNSGNHEFIYLGFMGASAGKTWTIDDVKMYEKVTESNDGYLINGDFETGISSPWENLWGSNTVTIVDGHDSSYGMKVNAGQYTVVRQKVTVEKNTDYVITLWSKNSVNGSLLIKDSADSQNIINQSLNTSSTWKETTVEFNSGNNTFVYVGFMGGAAGATYTVDDVVMTKKAAPEPVFGVVNGGFEDGKNGWTFGSGTNAIVSDAHSGNNAIQLTNPGLWASAAEQTIAVEPNTSYTITWWYKATPGTGVFNLYVMNASGYANLTSTGGKNYMNNFNGGWEKGSYVVNSGSAEAIIIKFSTEASNPGTILVDDVAIEKTAAHTHEYVGTVTKQPTCGATGVKTFTCSCGEGTYTETIPATGAHTYDNACDTSCNVCGATRTVSHSYSGACDQYCNLCGAKKTGFIVGAQHTYDNACDADCNVCGETRSVAGHAYDNACDADCNNCGAVRVTNHSYDNACDTDCNVCGATRTTEHNYVYSVMAQNNCGNDGMGKYTCSICGDSYTKIIPATGEHKYDNACDAKCNVCYKTREVGDHAYVATQTKAPTCTATGVMTYTCSECNDTYTESIDALGHNYKTVVTAPDCVNGGYTTHTCTVCGDSYKDSYTEAVSEHTYDDNGRCVHCQFRAQACLVDEFTGENRYFDTITEAMAAAEYEVQENGMNPCTVLALQYIYEDFTIPAGVSFSSEDNGVYATVTNNGAIIYGNFYEEVINNGTVYGGEYYGTVTNHSELRGGTYYGTIVNNGTIFNNESNGAFDFGEDFVLVNNGTVLCDRHIEKAEATCESGAICYLGCVYTDALDHTYSSAVTKAPTCDEDGIKTYTCSACGDSYTESIDALGHTAGAAADCENAQTCTVCGEVLVAALGHKWDDATCTAPKTCDRCGETEGDALGHSYSASVTKQPTCGQDGVKTYTCTCGDSYTETIPATGEHTYADEFDTDCDVCGATREVELPIAFGGNSVSEDVSGLAFRFDVEVQGMTANGTTAVYDAASVNGYKLISMGAVATNGVSEVDIPAVYLCELTDTAASYAVRVINIPASKYDMTITATPYFVVEIDGEQVTIYGEAQETTYNESVNNAPVA